MAKNKKNEVVEETAVAEPIATPAEPAVAIEEPKKWVVNCHRCGAALNVVYGNMVYMCPVCNTLFRMRTGAKLVKDVTRVIVSEAYVNVSKGVNE